MKITELYISYFAKNIKCTFFILAFLLLFSILFHKESFAESDVTWVSVTEGLETTEITIQNGTLFSSSVRVIRANLSIIKPSVIRSQDFYQQRSTARRIGLKSKALVTVNANFFDEKGDPLGLVISKGILRKSIHLKGQTLTGVFMTTESGASIVARNEFVPSLVVDALQAGPRLISNGKIISSIKDQASSRRSAVCIDSNNRLLIFASSGIWGLTFKELQSLMFSKNIACKEALNLDGGGSTQFFMAASNQFPETFIEGTDSAPVFLGLFPRTQ